MCSAPTRVAIVGHSYVTRLRDYCMEADERMNLGLPTDEFVINYHGVSGGSVLRGRRQAICQVLDGPRGVNRFQPDVVFLHVGENDVSRIQPGRLMECYIDFCNQLASINTVRVIVLGELLPFPVIVRNGRHQDCLQQCNLALRAVSRDTVNVDEVYMWHHRIGAYAPDARASLFHRDGVHMNIEMRGKGMDKYYASVRCAVVQAAKKLQSQKG